VEKTNFFVRFYLEISGVKGGLDFVFLEDLNIFSEMGFKSVKHSAYFLVNVTNKI